MPTHKTTLSATARDVFAYLENGADPDRIWEGKQSDIAAGLELGRATIQRNLDKLIENGLIRKIGVTSHSIRYSVVHHGASGASVGLSSVATTKADAPLIDAPPPAPDTARDDDAGTLDFETPYGALSELPDVIPAAAVRRDANGPIIPAGYRAAPAMDDRELARDARVQARNRGELPINRVQSTISDEEFEEWQRAREERRATGRYLTGRIEEIAAERGFGPETATSKPSLTGTSKPLVVDANAICLRCACRFAAVGVQAKPDYHGRAVCANEVQCHKRRRAWKEEQRRNLLAEAGGQCVFCDAVEVETRKDIQDRTVCTNVIACAKRRKSRAGTLAAD